MGGVGPPIGFGLDVAQDHVFDGQRQSGHFPGDVGLPATPSLAQVLQDGSRLVLLDACQDGIWEVRK